MITVVTSKEEVEGALSLFTHDASIFLKMNMSPCATSIIKNQHT